MVTTRHRKVEHMGKPINNLDLRPTSCDAKMPRGHCHMSLGNLWPMFVAHGCGLHDQLVNDLLALVRLRIKDGWPGGLASGNLKTSNDDRMTLDMTMLIPHDTTYNIHIYICDHRFSYIYVYIYYIYMYIKLPYISVYIHTYLPTYIRTYIHYITLHYITLHYITLHYITLHYITLHTYGLQWIVIKSRVCRIYHAASGGRLFIRRLAEAKRIANDDHFFLRIRDFYD